MQARKGVRYESTTASMGPRSSDRGYGGRMAWPAERGLSFNGSTVLRPWLCLSSLGTQAPRQPRASMGPRSSDRGYLDSRSMGSLIETSFNGSTVLRPWLCREELAESDVGEGASMGPRSSDRGYARRRPDLIAPQAGLQWVHGPQTVVMFTPALNSVTVCGPLQWVHGPQTVVMGTSGRSAHEPSRSFNGSTVLRPWLWRANQHHRDRKEAASMGPRSSDRGYASAFRTWRRCLSCFNGSTVLRPWLCCTRRILMRKAHCFNGSTVLRPWLCMLPLMHMLLFHKLQWVHGPQTVVMALHFLYCPLSNAGFNGSTVLRPWLWLRN